MLLFFLSLSTCITIYINCWIKVCFEIFCHPPFFWGIDTITPRKLSNSQYCNLATSWSGNWHHFSSLYTTYWKAPQCTTSVFINLKSAWACSLTIEKYICTKIHTQIFLGQHDRNKMEHNVTRVLMWTHPDMTSVQQPYKLPTVDPGRLRMVLRKRNAGKAGPWLTAACLENNPTMGILLKSSMLYGRLLVESSLSGAALQ